MIFKIKTPQILNFSMRLPKIAVIMPINIITTAAIIAAEFTDNKKRDAETMGRLSRAE